MSGSLLLPFDVAPVPFEDADQFLASMGLPFETRDRGGRRLCRHHQAPIRGRGAPCPLCVAAGRGVGGPEVEACRVPPPRSLIGHACRHEADHDGPCDFGARA